MESQHEEARESDNWRVQQKGAEWRLRIHHTVDKVAHGGHARKWHR